MSEETNTTVEPTDETIPSITRDEIPDETDSTSDQIFALIIEDDPDAAFIYKKAMADNDYKVEHFAHGGEAQTALKTLRPDVILLDMHLPEVDGITLLRQIRATEDLLNTPVILVTADHSLANTVEDEVNMVLLKPATYSQVKNLVSRIVRRSARES
jgi:DNA-binding response OmpR family regulator